MNYIKHLNLIFAVFDHDKRLGPCHVMIYLALFREWNHAGFTNPIQVNRELIMQKAKIKSPKTYAKTIREMANWGYFKYEQSTSRVFGSKIYMFPTSVFREQVMPPFYKHINNKPIYNETENNFQIQNFNAYATENKKSAPRGTPTNLQHVKIYFNEKKAPEMEAEKFFNYYEARNWLNNSFNPITNWKAAARNWIINIPKFNPQKTKNRRKKPPQQVPGNHKLNQNKNYNTPL
ncbi:hypothetical protein [Marinilabilia salmonicolor]|uniref:Uncharacterized protein n=1 Tax=Marinilabilia salmonicolor TaxID=989 RepID=A0A368VCW9_9BACT|nr:hypothetical protein [Marinilabilia salmonicolor]RCW39039.1 hypothetical protein DFO77_102194 [Marinilabilia salmonicolor]